MLDRKADVNAADSLRSVRSGNKVRNTGKDTVLHVAALGTTNPETIVLLLERGADLEIRNAEGRRPRRIATSANRAVIDDWLRSKRKRVPRTTVVDDHSIMEAIERGFYYCMPRRRWRSGGSGPDCIAP